MYISQASPAFDWAAVDTSQAGADIVSSYLNTEFKQIESQIRKLGKTDLLVPLVSSVASHVHLIHVSIIYFTLMLHLNCV